MYRYMSITPPLEGGHSHPLHKTLFPIDFLFTDDILPPSGGVHEHDVLETAFCSRLRAVASVVFFSVFIWPVCQIIFMYGYDGAQ